MTRYLEDLKVGQCLEVGSWFLEPDSVIAFARQWDPQPFHVDPIAAEASIFGGLTASSLHLFAICTRLFFDMEDPLAVMAMLGKDELRLGSPARAGSTVGYETTIEELRPSASKPDRGVVVLADRVSDESGLDLMTQKVSLLVRRRPSRGLG